MNKINSFYLYLHHQILDIMDPSRTKPTLRNSQPQLLTQQNRANSYSNNPNTGNLNSQPQQYYSNHQQARPSSQNLHGSRVIDDLTEDQKRIKASKKGAKYSFRKNGNFQTRETRSELKVERVGQFQSKQIKTYQPIRVENQRFQTRINQPPRRYQPTRVQAQIRVNQPPRKYQPLRVQSETRVIEPQRRYEPTRILPQTRIIEGPRIEPQVQDRIYKPSVPITMMEQESFDRDALIQETRNQNEIINLKEQVRRQQVIIKQIRDLAKNRKEQCERESNSLDVKCVNTLVEIYNLTLRGTNIRPLNPHEARLPPVVAQTLGPKFTQQLPPVRIATIPMSAPRANMQSISPAGERIVRQEQMRNMSNTGNIIRHDEIRNVSNPDNILRREERQEIRNMSNTGNIVRKEERQEIQNVTRYNVNGFNREQKPDIRDVSNTDNVVRREQRKEERNVSADNFVRKEERPDIRNMPAADNIFIPPEGIIKVEESKNQFKKVPPPTPQVPSYYPPAAQSEVSQQSEIYVRQIRELKTRIELLQIEKLKIVEKSKYSGLSEETTKDYRSQIERLKTEIYQFRSREQEYESQLLHSQNNIVYLQGLVNNKAVEVKQPATCSHDDYQIEINFLKEELNKRSTPVVSHSECDREITFLRGELGKQNKSATSHEECQREVANLQRQLKNNVQSAVSHEDCERELTSLREELGKKGSAAVSHDECLLEIAHLRGELNKANNIVISHEECEVEVEYLRGELNKKSQANVSHEECQNEINFLREQLSKIDQGVVSHDECVNEINFLREELNKVSQGVVSHEECNRQIVFLREELNKNSQGANHDEYVNQINFLREELNKVGQGEAASHVECERQIDYLQKELSNNQTPANHDECLKEVNFLREELSKTGQSQTASHVECQRQIDYLQKELSKNGQAPANHEECVKEINILREELSRNGGGVSKVEGDSEINFLRGALGSKEQEIVALNEKVNELHDYLQRAEDYILQLQNQQPQSNQSQNPRIARLQQALQQEYKNQQSLKEQYQLQIINLSKQIQLITNNYETKITNFTNLNIELTQSIKSYETQINILQIKTDEYKTILHQHEVKQMQNQEPKVAVAEKKGDSVDKALFEAAMVDISKKSLQVIVLMEEIHRLNLLSQEVREHLLKAESFIQETQGYIQDLEMQVKTSTYKSTDSNIYQIKNKELESKMISLNQQIRLWEEKEAQHKLELQNVVRVVQEYQGKLIILEQENSQLTNQIGSNKQLKDLEAKFDQQGLELNEVIRHLESAEEYIKQSSQLWQTANEAKEVLPEKLAIIEMLKKDLQITRNQNKDLQARIAQLQKLIEMMENRKPNAAPVDYKTKDTEKQLNNYIKLYNQSQSKLVEATRQVQTLKTNIQKSSSVTVTSRRTEQVSEGDTRLKNQLKNLESENVQIKNHLLGAETYINELQQQVASMNEQYAIIESEYKTHKGNSEQAHSALRNAEAQMAEMNKLIPKKAVQNQSNMR